VQKFTNAVYKGQVWVDTHSPKNIAEVIKPSFPDTSVDILETVAKRYKEIDAWCKEPAMKESSFELLQTVMAQAGELKQKVPFDKVVDTGFAEKAVK
jgi:NitT/TauT family transport system substrate-binding protein